MFALFSPRRERRFVRCRAELVRNLPDLLLL